MSNCHTRLPYSDLGAILDDLGHSGGNGYIIGRLREHVAWLEYELKEQMTWVGGQQPFWEELAAAFDVNPDWSECAADIQAEVLRKIRLAGQGTGGGA